MKSLIIQGMATGIWFVVIAVSVVIGYHLLKWGKSMPGVANPPRALARVLGRIMYVLSVIALFVVVLSLFGKNNYDNYMTFAMTTLFLVIAAWMYLLAGGSHMWWAWPVRGFAVICLLVSIALCASAPAFSAELQGEKVAIAERGFGCPTAAQAQGQLEYIRDNKHELFRECLHALRPMTGKVLRDYSHQGMGYSLVYINEVDAEFYVPNINLTRVSP